MANFHYIVNLATQSVTYLYQHLDSYILIFSKMCHRICANVCLFY